MFNDVEEFRAYVLHMLSEHRRLNAAVRTIERRWRVVDEGSKDTVSDLISGLEQLHRDLHHHFTDEENGGCIEEAVARCPSLSQAATKLEHEHTFLLSHLRGVIDQLEQGDIDRQQADPAHRDFRAFCKLLQEHEAAENELLERGFGVE